MSERCIVVDANVIFRALARDQPELTECFEHFGVVPHVPKFVFVELFKHKERLVAASRKAEAEVIAALHKIVAAMVFCDEALIPVGTWLEAHRLCAGIDEDDMPYVALALHLDADLWTVDLVLKTGLRARGFDRFFEL